MHKFNKYQLIHWTSYKSKRVCMSVLESEVVAFADASDLAYNIKWDLQNVSSQTISLSIETDSPTLFDVLTKSPMTTKKRLMIALQTMKESYRKIELRNSAFVWLGFRSADVLTKVKPKHLFVKVLSTGVNGHLIEKWGIRNGIVNGSIDKERGCSAVGWNYYPTKWLFHHLPSVPMASPTFNTTWMTLDVVINTMSANDPLH